MELKQQIQKTAEDMATKVIRIDKGKNHGYVRNSDGKLLAGVTEVSSAAGYKEAKAWMPSWGGKEAVKCLGYFEKFENEQHLSDFYAADAIKAGISKMTLTEYLLFLHEAKSGWARKSDKAKETGTDGHFWLEAWIGARIKSEKEPEMPKFGEYIENGIKEFIAWTNENVKEFVLAEAQIARPEVPYEYAGTLDALAIMKNDKAAVLDFKFADNKSITWALQTAAYAKTFEPYKIDVSERYALRFPKTEFLKEWNKDKYCYIRIPNKFEVIRYDPSYLDFDFQTFLAYRQADKWVNAVMKRD